MSEVYEATQIILIAGKVWIYGWTNVACYCFTGG